MKVYEGIEHLDDALRGAVLTVGNFDGVHLGHQRIMRTAHALATVSSASVLVMTFEPHPLAVLRPQNAPPLLTPWEEKLRQFERVGVQAVVRLKVDAALLSLAAEEFVREVLIRRIHPSYLVEGPDFGFGRDRGGNVDLLRKMSAKGGFQVHVVEPYRLTLSDGEHAVASSTVVRKCLREGRIADASACLGRPYTLVGRVIHGEGLGRRLGFPTINLDVGGQLVPAEGVYAGRAELAGRRRLAAISIGRRPTLSGATLAVEAFILDDAGDWYGESARVDVVRRLREQIRYERLDDLVEQMARDVEEVRRVLTTE